MRFNDEFKHPRLYVDAPLNLETGVSIEPNQIHYLKNVMRKNNGDTIRLFNGRDGEWLAAIDFTNKKQAAAKPFEHFKHQPKNEPSIHLLFAPIKKSPMGFLIEKAVELGVTDLHPIITARTENRKVNTEKMQSHVTEAAEQCERLSLPKIHEARKLTPALQDWDTSLNIHWCAERMEGTQNLSACKTANVFLVGPEGGFDESENAYLQSLNFITAIDLGEQILRAETAALYCLSHAKLTKK